MLELLLLDYFPLYPRCFNTIKKYPSPPYLWPKQKRHNDLQEQQLHHLTPVRGLCLRSVKKRTRPPHHKRNWKKGGTVRDQ